MASTYGVLDKATGVFNASGNLSLKVGPKSAREIWTDITVSVSANKNPTNESDCFISIGDLQTKSQRDATQNGSTGDSTAKTDKDTVKCGEYVWADWFGGDVGQTATLVVTGTRTV